MDKHLPITTDNSINLVAVKAFETVPENQSFKSLLERFYVMNGISTVEIAQSAPAQQFVKWSS